MFNSNNVQMFTWSDPVFSQSLVTYNSPDSYFLDSSTSTSITTTTPIILPYTTQFLSSSNISSANQPLDIKNTFVKGDNVYLWFKLLNVTNPVAAKIKVYFPNGNLAFTTTWNSVPASQTYDLWTTSQTIMEDLECNGNNRSGKWTVELYLDTGNGYQLKNKDYFTVDLPATVSDIFLTTTSSNVNLGEPFTLNWTNLGRQSYIIAEADNPTMMFSSAGGSWDPTFNTKVWPLSFGVHYFRVRLASSCNWSNIVKVTVGSVDGTKYQSTIRINTPQGVLFSYGQQSFPLIDVDFYNPNGVRSLEAQINQGDWFRVLTRNVLDMNDFKTVLTDDFYLYQKLLQQKNNIRFRSVDYAGNVNVFDETLTIYNGSVCPIGEVQTSVNSNSTGMIGVCNSGINSQSYLTTLAAKNTDFSLFLDKKQPEICSNFFASQGDGYIINLSANYLTARNALRANWSLDFTTYYSYTLSRYEEGNYVVTRSFTPFDTSTLPDSASITSADAYFYIIRNSSYGNASSFPFSVSLVETTQSSNYSLTKDDFSKVKSTPLSNSLSSLNIPTESYLKFSLNTNGLLAISKTGYTNMSPRFDSDINAIIPPTNSSNIQLTWYSTDQSGTTTDPYLHVCYMDDFQNITELARVNIQDINNDGYGDVAILAFNADGVPVVVIKDIYANKILKGIKFFNQKLLVQFMQITNNHSGQLAITVVVRDNFGNLQHETRDGYTGNLIVKEIQ